ncbi:MAG TPA: LuxR C-terminal-related transcriptional regulator [Acidimicrobiales bacterium]|nr:LuxR C-terminal-related transcriptional regulator [Acidimicrobiales bacterium]
MLLLDLYMPVYMPVLGGHGVPAGLSDAAHRPSVVVLTSAADDNGQIAATLIVGEQTVKTHVSSILTKLGMQDRVQAAVSALRHRNDPTGGPQP